MTHLPLTLAQENLKPADSTLSATPATQDGTATTVVPTDGSQKLPPKKQDPFGGSFMIILLVMMGVMVLLTFRSQSKDKKKRQQLLATLGKGDKVQTIGGVIGSVVEIRDDEVIVKVDENNNIKMKFARSAIQNKIESPGS